MIETPRPWPTLQLAGQGKCNQTYSPLDRSPLKDAACHVKVKAASGQFMGYLMSRHDCAVDALVFKLMGEDDKTIETCRMKFNNLSYGKYDGVPFIPPFNPEM